MPTLKQLFTLAPELPQPINFSFNEAIDFCLWILELDGLQVYPFHLHNPHGTGELRSCGLTSESWQQWFERVIRLQDLNLKNLNLNFDAEEWANKQINIYRQQAETIKKCPEFSEDTIESIDFDTLRQTLIKHHFIWQQRRRSVEQILQPQLDLLQINRAICNPVFAFKGSALLEACLREKWHQYRKLVDDRPQSFSKSEVLLDNPELGSLTALNIFSVGYPSQTQFLLPPNYVVVSNFDLEMKDSRSEIIYWSLKSLAEQSLHQARS
jgi:hypothetical protein